VTGQDPLWINPLGFHNQIHTWKTHGSNLLSSGVGDSSGKPNEAAAWTRELRLQRRNRLIQQGAQTTSHISRVLDVARIGEDRRQTDRNGQRLEVAVKNGASDGLEFQNLKVLSTGDGNPMGGFENLQPEEPTP
jgi:hypothetical protein